MSPKTSASKSTIRIRSEPFARGAMRYAFPAFDEVNQTKQVVKAYAMKGKNRDAQGLVQADVMTQAHAQFFADEFSIRVPDYPIQFVQAKAAQKYTSNNGYVAKDSDLMQAFSHFTYHFSGGDMLVTDIQGVSSSVLTDPQIHSPQTTDFGRGNLGIKGMDGFFLSHKCNAFCEELNLKASPMQIKSLPEDEDGSRVSIDEILDESLLWGSVTSGSSSLHSACLKLFDTPSKPSSARDAGPLLCQGGCGNKVALFGAEYVAHKKRYGGTFCCVCLQRVEATLCRVPCKSSGCVSYSTYSTFVSSITNADPPELCRKCRKKAACAPLCEFWSQCK